MLHASGQDRNGSRDGVNGEEAAAQAAQTTTERAHGVEVARQARATVLIVDEAVAFGGSIVSTANLVRGLDQARWEPIFVTATSAAHVRSKLREAAEGTRVVVARKWLDYARLGRMRDWVARTVPGFALRKAAIYGIYALRLAVNLPYTLRIAWLVLRHRADLVQLNNGFGNDEAAIACRVLGREPTAFFRGSPAPGLVDRLLLTDRIRAYAAVSNFERQRAVEGGIPEERIVVATPAAVPEETPRSGEEVRRDLGIPPEAPVVGLVGRVVPWKGQIEFVEAMERMARRQPDVVAMIVGDASDGDEDYMAAVRARVVELGLESRVVFTGYVEDVDAHYRAMDVVAHASVEPEPSGRVIFEAMANGVPVVASCHGGPPEFVDEGVDGHVVDPRDTERFADRIAGLLADPDRRASMGEAGRRKVLGDYDLKSYARVVERVYERCLR